jgi:hypothetical protein
MVKVLLSAFSSAISSPIFEESALFRYIGEGMWHGLHSAAARTLFPEGQIAFEQIGDFADELSGNAPS